MALSKATLSSQQPGKDNEIWELSGAHTGCGWQREGLKGTVSCTPSHPPLHFRGGERDIGSFIPFLAQNSWAQGAQQ